MDATADSLSSKRRFPSPSVWLGCLLVIGASLAVYHQVPTFPLVWTDHAEIEQGTLVPTTLGELWRFLSLPKGVAKRTERNSYSTERNPSRFGYFRPLKALTYGVDYFVGAGKPWSFHLTNLLLHLVVCLLLLLVGRSLFGQEHPFLAEAVAVLHAVGPVHVESVCWISARSDVLWGLFTLGTVALLLRARTRSRPWVFRALAGLFTLLGIASKEAGLAAVPISIVVSALVPDPDQPSRLRRVLAECWPVAAAATLFLIYRLSVVSDIRLGSLADHPGLGIWTLLHLFGLNLTQSFIPWNLRLADTIEAQGGPSLLGMVGLFLVLSWVFLGIRLRKRSPIVLITALGWLVAILPVSQLIPLLQPRGERYLYVPGLFAEISLLWLVWTLFAFLRSRSLRIILKGVGFVGLAGLAVLSHFRSLPWSNERWLFSSAVEQEPHCTECWNNLAYAEAISGNYRQAVDACYKAMAIDRHRYLGYIDGFSVRWILSRSLLLLGEGQAAVRWLEEIVLKAGATPANLAMLAEAYLQARRPGHALAVLEEALRMKPADTQVEHMAQIAAQEEAMAGYPSFEQPLACMAE